MNTTQQFLTWLKTNEPALYEVAMVEARKQGLAGWSDVLSKITDTISTSLPKIAVTASKIAPTILNYKLQKEQVKRASSGAPPLDYSQYVTQAMSTVQEQATRAAQGLPPAPTPNYQTQLAPVQNPSAAARFGKQVANEVAVRGLGNVLPMVITGGVVALFFLLRGGRRRGR